MLSNFTNEGWRFLGNYYSNRKAKCKRFYPLRLELRLPRIHARFKGNIVKLKHLGYNDFQMDMKQRQKLSQKLTLTPYMRQSLRMLELPLLELKDYLEAQLEENPTLKREETSSEDSLPYEKIEKFIQQERNLTDFSSIQSQEEVAKKHDYKKTLISKAPTLEEHLLKQLRTFSLDKQSRRIGEYILTNLDKNGYLNLSLEEIASKLNKKKAPDEKITKKDIEKVLGLIYNFDPPGICARNLKECLLIQLRLKNKQESLAYKIVSLYLSELIKKKIALIAKKLKVSSKEINAALGEISSLSPWPGKSFESTTAQIISASAPDIIIQKTEGKLEVIVNTKFLPKLKINPYYMNLLESKKVSPKTKKYIQEKINSALALIKSVSQREETVQKIVQNIVEIQKDFFEQGDRSLLKPLTHKKIAKIVKRNESTVSRVINSKYIHTPYGDFKLNHFFSKSLETACGHDVSQEYVKHQILDILKEKDSQNLKDSEIAKLLKTDGVKIARRTVAKYRKELNIPAYHQRKRQGKNKK